MKKTINTNLGGLVFQIDEDAYDRLSKYLESLKNKFTDIDERNEIIQDIEYRFAELFGADINNTKQVVSLEMVNSAIATMGEPEEIEEELEENEAVSKKASFNSNEKVSRKLFRDPDDKIFAGVLSGVSKYFGIQDAIWLRIVMVLLTIASIGAPTILIYIILWIVMPEAKTSSDRLQMNGEPINLDNIEDQVKKNVNTEEIKRTSVRVANKFSEIVPLALKVVAVFLIFIFGFQFIALMLSVLGGGAAISMFHSEYIALIFGTKGMFFIGAASIFLMLAIPLLFAIYLAIKLLTKKKINWLWTIMIAFALFILSIVGIAFAGFDTANQFKAEAEQTNFVALENPTVDELDIEFPFEKLKDDLNLSFHFGNNGRNDDFEMEGIEVFPSLKKIHINMVDLDIKTMKTDSIFKLSKTLYSNGKNIEDAEENISHIHHEFENLDENVISIPKMMILENETKWRNQSIKYELFIPVGKRVYFGDKAKKVIDDVDFNGEYSKRDLANNTWEMTKSGLKCITCEESEDDDTRVIININQNDDEDDNEN